MEWTTGMLRTIKRMTGCTYFVLNSAGGLLGGFQELGAAQQSQKEWQERYDHDKLNKGMTVRIQEIQDD